MISALVLLDGTNLFCRFKAEQLRIVSLRKICTDLASPYPLKRAYLASSTEHWREACAYHGEPALTDIRVDVLPSVQLSNGKFREKGVDTILVMQGMKRLPAVGKLVVVSTDQDFHPFMQHAQATAEVVLVSFFAQPPSLSVGSAHSVLHITRDEAITRGWAAA